MTKKAVPYIAELHDIGKLVDRHALVNAGFHISGHTYYSFDFDQLGIEPPSSPSWWGQWSDSIKSLDKKSGLPSDITDEGKVCVLLTNIADELAASISRTLTEFSDEFKNLKRKGELAVEGLHLLWNPVYYTKAIKAGKHWAAFRTPDELKIMFDFINQCRSPEVFLEKYRDNLSLTPEDKSSPLNFIPLGTHLDLMGKIFRVLRYWSKLLDDNGKLGLEYDRQKVANVTEAAGSRVTEEAENRGKWVFRLVQCYIYFPQSLARLQDLNVLSLRRKKIKEIINAQMKDGDPERQTYAVLFHTDDFLSLFLPKESILPLREVMQPLLVDGFYFEYEELEAELNLLTSTGHRTRHHLIDRYGSRAKARTRRYLELRYCALWPDLEEAINPPLCDLCQQRQGTVYTKDLIREWLCHTCRGIRDMGEPASIISDWEETSKSVIWLKVSLDQNLLLKCLQRLFENYVDSGPNTDRILDHDRKILKENFRPLAAQIEFARRYQDFLDDFQASLYGKVNTYQKIVKIEPSAILYPIQSYKELLIICLDSQKQLGLILDVFLSLLTEYFPKCLDDSPIRLSVSLSNIKYPYHEHWQFFGEDHMPGVIFHLQQPGVCQIQLTAQQFQSLREMFKGTQLKHFLHNLAAIEGKTGELTAMMRALEQKDRFLQIQSLMLKQRLSFRQILDFYRLVGATDQE
jgi:hypothetical protein